MNFEWWQILLMVGASIRLTRLVVDDTLMQPVRWWVEQKEGKRNNGYINDVSFTTLLNCSWCAGMWIAGLVVGLSVAWSGFYWLWLVLSVAHLVGTEAVLREKLEVD